MNIDTQMKWLTILNSVHFIYMAPNHYKSHHKVHHNAERNLTCAAVIVQGEQPSAATGDVENIRCQEIKLRPELIAGVLLRFSCSCPTIHHTVNAFSLPRNSDDDKAL